MTHEEKADQELADHINFIRNIPDKDIRNDIAYQRCIKDQMSGLDSAIENDDDVLADHYAKMLALFKKRYRNFKKN